MNSVGGGLKVGEEGEGERGGAGREDPCGETEAAAAQPPWWRRGGAHAVSSCHRGGGWVRDTRPAAPSLPREPPSRPLGGAGAAERFNRAAAAALPRPSPGRGGRKAPPALASFPGPGPRLSLSPLHRGRPAFRVPFHPRRRGLRPSPHAEARGRPAAVSLAGQVAQPDGLASPVPRQPPSAHHGAAWRWVPSAERPSVAQRALPTGPTFYKGALWGGLWRHQSVKASDPPPCW